MGRCGGRRGHEQRPSVVVGLLPGPTCARRVPFRPTVFGLRANSSTASCASRPRGSMPRTSAPPPSDEPADLYGATGSEPFVTSWWAMVDQFLRITSPRRERETAEADTATLDFATAQGSHCTGRLQLSTVAPGSATAEVWLHNRGPVDMGKVVLRSGDLLSHEGSVITARSMRLEPDIVPMPARSSRGVTVEVDIDENVAPGSYRGMLVADGHPDVWLPIELVVKPLLP